MIHNNISLEANQWILARHVSIKTILIVEQKYRSDYFVQWTFWFDVESLSDGDINLLTVD